MRVGVKFCIFFATILLVGCTNSKAVPKELQPSAPLVSATPAKPVISWPDLIATRNGSNREPGSTRRYRYSKESKRYELHAKTELNGRKIVSGKNGLLLVDSDRETDEDVLTLLDDDLNKLKEARFEGNLGNRFGPFEAHEEYFVTSDRKGLVCLDSNLKEVDKLHLGSNKYAHELFIESGVIYALDNVVYPIWVLRVALTAEGKFKELERVDLTPEDYDAPIPHLRDHWLAQDHWWIVKEVNYTKQSVLRAPVGRIENYKEMPFRWILDETSNGNIQFRRVADDEIVEHFNLLHIESTTEKSPPFAVLNLQDDTAALVRLQWENDELRPNLLHHFPNTNYYADAGLLTETAGRVWCLSGNELHIFSDSGELLLEQKLDFYPDCWEVVTEAQNEGAKAFQPHPSITPPTPHP